MTTSHLIRSVRASATIAAIVILLATGAVPSVAAPEPSIHTPRPAPHDVISTGHQEISAWVQTDADLTRVELHIDGQPSDSTVGDRRAMGWPIAASADLSPGPHTFTLQVQDAAGASAERHWSATATNRSVQRIFGADRHATSAQVARSTHPVEGHSAAAVLARGDDFADALAGVPLAVHLDAPLLLTRSGGLPETVMDELRRTLEPGGAVHLLGGTAAIGLSVEEALEHEGFTPLRHAGRTRWETAASIANELPASTTAFVVSGQTFADALAASVPAAIAGAPIVLTMRDELPAASRTALEGVTEVTIVGGVAAVADAVETDLQRSASVTRVAGQDRYATAVAVMATFDGATDRVGLASGIDFADALAGARHSSARGQPLLLTQPHHLAHPTADALAAAQPATLALYGGAAAVDRFVADTALRSMVDGPAPRLHAVAPGPGSTVAFLDELVLTFDSAVTPSATRAHLQIGRAEVPLAVEAGGTPDSVRARLAAGTPIRPIDLAHDARITVAVDTGQSTGHGVAAFTYLVPDPVYARAGQVDLHLPSRSVELVGFHESNHDGAQRQEVRDTTTPKVVMETRYRGNDPHSAADIVADPDLPVYAPATGTVVRAGSYRLYCDDYDHFLVIEPDAQPGWEVKLLHFTGLAVGVGDRVEAGVTQVGDGPRPLPFESQVDEYSSARNWPHVHVEVVDPSIPDRPGSGC